MVAFRMFDKDGDGDIDPSELQKCFKFFGQNPTMEEIIELIKEVDDGRVRMKKFCYPTNVTLWQLGSASHSHCLESAVQNYVLFTLSLGLASSGGGIA